MRERSTQEWLDQVHEQAQRERFVYTSHGPIPQPVVIELDPEHGMTAFQAAVREASIAQAKARNGVMADVAAGFVSAVVGWGFATP